MRKYTVLNPTFKDEIIITETGDPGHADNINSGPKQIFQNTLVNNKEIKEGDSQNRTVTFTSNDSTDAKSWTNVAVMESGENHKSLFEKISTIFKNVRFLYKLLGTTNISTIKDGTVTGILNALDQVAFTGIYSDLHNKPLALPASDVYTWAKQATKPAYAKSEVGLGNVNNTSDKDKPVSTAQQTALDKKVNFTDISRSTAVNIAGKKALDAMEKNPSVEGTMAHDISQIYSNMTNYKYLGINGGDANTIKTNYHKFVFNMSNLPEAYGFLDVSKFGGDGFSPSPAGVIRQQFTGWNTGKNYTRCYYGSTWTNWVAEAAKTDLNWKTVSLSGVDTEISTTGKTINLPDEVKSARELVVSTEVGGAVELKRVMLLIPNTMDWNGSYVCRETQIASIWIRYSDGTLIYGAFMLQGFIPYISGILYR